MNCVRCLGKKRISREYCRKCFIDIFEKRVRRSLRGVFKARQRVSTRDPLVKYVLERVLKLPLVISTRGVNVTSHSRDELLACRLRSYFSRVSAKPVVSVFSAVTREDIVLYAPLRKLPYKPTQSDELDFLHAISSRYPEVIQA